MAEEKFMQLKMSTEQNLNPLGDVSLDANKCQDLHRRFDHFSNVVVEVCSYFLCIFLFFLLPS